MAIEDALNDLVEATKAIEDALNDLVEATKDRERLTRPLDAPWLPPKRREEAGKVLPFLKSERREP